MRNVMEFKEPSRFAILLVFAFALRLIWALLVPVAPVSDASAYMTFAQNLVQAGTYGFEPDTPSCYWPPGTSLIYAAALRVFGSNTLAVVVPNLLSGTLLVALTYAYAKDRLGSAVAFLAGVFVALWPTLVQYTTIPASEIHYAVLVLLSLLLVERVGWPFPVRGLSGGLAAGLGCLVRPTALLVPLLAAPALLSREKWPKTLAVVILAFVGLFVVVLPWTYRNYHAFGKWVLVSANGGANLWMGNNPHTEGKYMPLPPETRGMDEAERDKYLGQQGRDYILSHPDAFLRNVALRAYLLHRVETIGIGWNVKGLTARYPERIVPALKAVSTGYYWIMLLLGVTGVAMFFRQEGLLRVFCTSALLFWAYHAAVHLITVAAPRYHVSSNPVTAIFAAYAVWSFMKRKAAQADPECPVAGAAGYGD